MGFLENLLYSPIFVIYFLEGQNAHYRASCYRLQMKFARVMFLHLSFCSQASVHAGIADPPLPWEQTPEDQNPPPYSWEQTPPGPDPARTDQPLPPRSRSPSPGGPDPSRSRCSPLPPAQCMLGKRAVHILLECILVFVK